MAKFCKKQRFFRVDNISGKWARDSKTRMSIKQIHFRGIRRKLEALCKGLPYATIRSETDGVAIFMEFLDEGKTHLALTVGGERTGYQDPLSQIIFQGHQIKELGDVAIWVAENIRVSQFTYFYISVMFDV